MKRIAQPSRRSLIHIFLGALVVVLLAACGEKAPDTMTKISGDKSSLSSESGQDPCSLLESREVEAVLGGSLAGPPYRINPIDLQEGPSADGNACRYAGAGYHFIDVEVDWKGGAGVMKMLGVVQNLADQKMKGVLKLGDGSELTGEWDEAKVLGCCTFIAMQGDRLVKVKVAATNATLAQAASIANSALKRIDKPLAVNGAHGAAAAIARDAARPKQRDPCSLVSRAEAETILGAPLAKDPETNRNECTYAYTGKFPSGVDITSVISIKVSWRYGFAEFRENNAMVSGMGKVFGQGSGPDQGKKNDVADPALRAGTWEVAQDGPLGFSAVKNDVLITADSRGTLKQEDGRNLVALAMSKL